MTLKRKKREEKTGYRQTEEKKNMKTERERNFM